jgi:hypothetical protein
MTAATNRDRSVAVCAGEPMNPFERQLMKLDNVSSPQLEGTLPVFYMIANHLECESELSESILGLSTRDLVLIGE